MALCYIKHITFLNHYTAAHYTIRATMVRFIIHIQQEIMHIVVFAVTVTIVGKVCMHVEWLYQLLCS